MLRTGLAAILLVLLIPMVVAANTSWWALRTVLDPEAFSTTVGRALDTPELERLVASSLADGIVDRVDRAPTGSLGLPRRLLAVRVGVPADASDVVLRAALGDRILDAMSDPGVRQVRDEVVSAVHGEIIGAVEGRSGLVTVRGKKVVLDTAGVLDRIETAADPRIAALVEGVPNIVAAPIVIAEVDGLGQVQEALRLMRTLQLLLPLVAVTAALVVVILAHRRTRAFGIVGFAIAVAGAVSLAVLWVAGGYVSSVPDAEVARRVAGEVYDAFLSLLLVQAALLVAVGLVLAVFSWLVARGERRRATARMLGPR
jgi:hypothetical protein